jgi:hypothetical protein
LWVQEKQNPGRIAGDDVDRHFCCPRAAFFDIARDAGFSLQILRCEWFSGAAARWCHEIDKIFCPLNNDLVGIKGFPWVSFCLIANCQCQALCAGRQFSAKDHETSFILACNGQWQEKL